MLGCVISGANAPGNLGLLNLVRKWGGSEAATVLVHGGKFPAPHAALVNSVMARSYDFEATQASVNGTYLPSHIQWRTNFI